MAKLKLLSIFTGPIAVQLELGYPVLHNPGHWDHESFPDVRGTNPTEHQLNVDILIFRLALHIGGLHPSSLPGKTILGPFMNDATQI